VTELVTSPELQRDILVAGVGRAVVDLLRSALNPTGTPLVAITITGGTATSRIGSRWSVPKRDLVAAAQVALQSKKLKIASALSTAQTLVNGLTAYRVKISETGQDSYENKRDSASDDLVLAVAIAAYAATKRRGARTVYAEVRSVEEVVRPPRHQPDLVEMTKGSA
jgi:hypothetical protein